LIRMIGSKHRVGAHRGMIASNSVRDFNVPLERRLVAQSSSLNFLIRDLLALQHLYVM
jgi:hypothetical protein